jgi:hypothetical protein
MPPMLHRGFSTEAAIDTRDNRTLNKAARCWLVFQGGIADERI